jgi:hypothetical protein
MPSHATIIGSHPFARLSGYKQSSSIQYDSGNDRTMTLERNFAVVAFTFKASL